MQSINSVAMFWWGASFEFFFWLFISRGMLGELIVRSYLLCLLRELISFNIISTFIIVYCYLLFVFFGGLLCGVGNLLFHLLVHLFYFITKT